MEISINDDGVLLCPVCGFEYTHVDIAQISAHGEDAEPNEIMVHAITGSISTHNSDPAPSAEGRRNRRHRISMTGRCEDGHSFAIVFSQYKGYTYVDAIKVD